MAGNKSTILVLTGVIGSGCSTVLRFLEDLGYRTFSNFNPALVPAWLALGGLPERVALNIELSTVDQVQQTLYLLKEAGHEPNLVFLEADTPTILARYALTRRPHPLIAQAHSLEAAISLDRAQVGGVRAFAHRVLDTSGWSVQELRREVDLLATGTSALMTVNLISFGYKYSVPPEANMVFDIRFLPNPFYIEQLKPLTGKDQGVIDYIFGFALTQTTYDHILQTLHFFLNQYLHERRGQVAIAIGCTGGQHRSVAFVERLAQTLVGDKWRVRVKHREQESHRGHV